MPMTDQAPVAVHPLRGCSVLVAGATGGIGGAIARELDRRGAALTLVARDARRLEDLAVPGTRHAADLRSPEACAGAVAAAGGRLDVLVNAVGVVAFGSVTELSYETLQELFVTNVFVAVLLARAALAVLEPGGAIVNIPGVIAERNLPRMAAYGASKAAVRAFDEALAREARRSRIRVLDARPPHTETGLAARAIAGNAPRMPAGLPAESVAVAICDALERGASELPSEAFTSAGR